MTSEQRHCSTVAAALSLPAQWDTFRVVCCVWLVEIWASQPVPILHGMHVPADG